MFVDREGGHPAATLDRCVVRRWTAPAAGRLEIRGQLAHRTEHGNGVRATLLSSRAGQLGQWSAHHGSVDTGPLETSIDAGDTIDFVVDFAGEIVHDEHAWPVTLRLRSETGEQDWDSARDFHGPQSSRWVDYVQALLMTNEFVFTD